MNPEFVAIPVAVWTGTQYLFGGAPRWRKALLGGALLLALTLRFTDLAPTVPSVAVLLLFVVIGLYGLIARRVGALPISRDALATANDPPPPGHPAAQEFDQWR